MKITITKILVLMAGFLLISAPVSAQDDDSHGLITVRTTKVKPGQAQEYRELLTQLAASRKAAGHSGVTAWQIIRGPVDTFYTVTSAENHAEYGNGFDSGMSDADWQRWLGRITDVIEWSVLTTLRTHGELSVPAEPGSTPNMVMLRFTTLKSGNNGDHHDWLAETLVPAFKEGGRKGWNVSNVTMGDDVNTWISSIRIDSWQQLDGPGPFAHMSERARRNMFEDYNERVQSSKVELLRFLPELSY